MLGNFGWMLGRIRGELRCWWRGYHTEETTTRQGAFPYDPPIFILTGRCLSCHRSRGKETRINDLRPGAIIPLNWEYGE